MEGAIGSIYVGFFEMGLTFWLWLKAMQTAYSTARISNLIYLSPFLSLIFIHYIVGERIYASTFVALLLILAGLWIQTASSDQSAKE